MKSTFHISFFLALVIILLGTQAMLAKNGNSNSANDTVSNDQYKKRLIGVSVAVSGLYIASISGLYYLWYADYPKSSFHFFNDCDQWMGMDKAGHVTSSYWIGRIGFESLRWSGVENKKAIWYGGTWGLAYLTTVEIFDGFSAEWGFSGCDMAANTFGAGLFIGQQLLWDDQRFTLKFSFHPTEYADYRPDLLGENFIQQMLKDYNGQTYWLSANIASFIKKENKFPKWLNVSLGYSAEGMLGATSNPAEFNGQPLPDYERYSQYLFSIDIDPTKIRTRNETVRLLLNLIGYIKFPFPALELNSKGVAKWHWIYY